VIITQTFRGWGLTIIKITSLLKGLAKAAYKNVLLKKSVTRLRVLSNNLKDKHPISAISAINTNL